MSFSFPFIHENRVPFFSVIVCTYNRANILPKALESLQNQTMEDWEALIIDDGSSDDTFTIAKQFTDSDSRFRYQYHMNKGTGLTRNTGLVSSCGLFVTFLDSDDTYKPNHLALRRDILEQNNFIEFLHGGVEIIGDEYVPDKDDPDTLIHLDDCVIGGTFVIRRDMALELEGFSPVRYGDDALFYEKAKTKGLVIASTDARTYVYNRKSEDSLCTTVEHGGLEALEGGRQGNKKEKFGE